MKTRFFFLLKLYAAYVVTSVFMKLVFLMYNHSAADFSFTDVLQVLRHGLIMDCSVAGYLIALPLLTTMISVWLPSYKWWRPALLLYTSLIGFALFGSFPWRRKPCFEKSRHNDRKGQSIVREG